MSEISKNKGHAKINCLNLFKLLLAALPTIVFGVFTIVFSLQQDASARATREQDQRQADEINRRAIFKEYIDDMKELLLDEHFAENMNRSLLQMRIQTLTVLRHLDPPRKYDLIRFLYENDLIRNDRSPTIDLTEADLSNLQFIGTLAKPCVMSYLYLPGVYAENITFISCQIYNSTFDSAIMSGANFNTCNLGLASFKNSYLKRSQFAESTLFGANFRGANLVQSSFKNAIVQAAELINVDMYQSDLDNRVLYPINHDGIVPNEIFNSRFPNGSTSDLVNYNMIDGSEAESLCHLNSTTLWYDAIYGIPLQIVNSNEIPIKDKLNIEQRCFFRMNQKQKIISIVQLLNYSMLIDLKRIMFNLSLWTGLSEEIQDDRITIIIHFVQMEGGFDYSNSFKKSIKATELFQNYSVSHEIPPSTRFFYVSFVCNTLRGKNEFCIFDHVKLFVYHKNTSL